MERLTTCLLRGCSSGTRSISHRRFGALPRRSAAFSWRRCYATEVKSDTPTTPRRVTLLPGDGIGPEITDSVVGIFGAAKIPIVWERFDDFGKSAMQSEREFQELLSSVARNRVALKGPLYTSFLEGPAVSRNVRLRTSLDLYAFVVQCTNNGAGLNTRHAGIPIDFVVIRENMQGEYSGFEQEVEPGVVQCLKITTERSSMRIAEFAFRYATEHNRKKVTCIHKANIQKQTDGLFLSACRKVAEKYPNIEYKEMIVDNCCMQLVMNPTQFDVMVTPNLYGNIISNVGAGLVGGPGIVGGANIGQDIAVFEPARHVAQDIAGKNTANPIGFIRAAVMMLRHLGMEDHANRIQDSLDKVVNNRKLWTPDLGGSATTKDITHAVIQHLK